MISLYIGPDKTQIVKGRVQKGPALSIQEAVEIPSYWDALQGDEDTGQAELLPELFRELKEAVQVSYEEVYIVLPDVLFSIIDCIPYATDADILRRVQEAGNPDELYTVTPFFMAKFDPLQKTIFSIRKKYIDALVKAAASARITLAAIEAESLAFFRCMNAWDRDCVYVEMFSRQACMVTFSPIGGMFRTEAPTLSTESLASLGNGANSEVTSVYSANGFSMSKTFRNMNTDAEHIVATEREELLTLPAVRDRLPRERKAFPDMVLSDILPREQQSWMPAVGTLLQALPEEELYRGKPAFLQLSSTNLLPEEAQAAARNRQWKQIVMKTCNVLAIAFLTVLLAEAAGILYFSSQKVPPSLQADYEEAQRGKDALEREMALVKQATGENHRPLDAYGEVLRNRPDNCQFTELTIGTPDGKLEGKNMAKYIHLSAVSTDEMAFHDLTAGIKQGNMFGVATVNSINTEEGGLKTADISIGREAKTK